MWYKNSKGQLINIYRNSNIEVRHSGKHYSIMGDGRLIETFDEQEHAEDFLEFLATQLRALNERAFIEWNRDNQAYAKTAV